MNFQAIKVIFKYEMLRTWETMFQSIASPVLSTSLYFIVFGSAIGSRIQSIEGVSYGLFIVPGLTMLTLLTQSIANASFGIFFPKFTGSIYEIHSAPISFLPSHCSVCVPDSCASVRISLILCPRIFRISIVTSLSELSIYRK